MTAAWKALININLEKIFNSKKIIKYIHIFVMGAAIQGLKDTFAWSKNLICLFLISCKCGPMRPDDFVDLCENCVKTLEERDLESENYKNVHAVN